MILCLLSESCTACQSRPPTSALLRDRLGISHPFCLLQRGLQFFGGIRTVMEYVSDFGCSGTLRRETVRIKADKIWTGHSSFRCDESLSEIHRHSEVCRERINIQPFWCSPPVRSSMENGFFRSLHQLSSNFYAAVDDRSDDRY